MPSFLVVRIYLLLLLTDDGEGVGWFRFFHGGSDKDKGDNCSAMELIIFFSLFSVLLWFDLTTMKD